VVVLVASQSEREVGAAAGWPSCMVVRAVTATPDIGPFSTCIVDPSVDATCSRVHWSRRDRIARALRPVHDVGSRFGRRGRAVRTSAHTPNPEHAFPQERAQGRPELAFLHLKLERGRLLPARLATSDT
jgi:hypothetical protein